MHMHLQLNLNFVTGLPTIFLLLCTGLGNKCSRKGDNQGNSMTVYSFTYNGLIFNLCGTV